MEAFRRLDDILTDQSRYFLEQGDRNTALASYHNPQYVKDKEAAGYFSNAKRPDMITFMKRRLLYADDDEDVKQWGPVRILGAGGFGRVGLWEKRNVENVTVDRLVCKEIPWDPEMMEQEFDSDFYPRVLSEAVIQNDLHANSSRLFPEVRNYKFVQDGKAPKQKKKLSTIQIASR
jgi:hypothetical protein